LAQLLLTLLLGGSRVVRGAWLKNNGRFQSGIMLLYAAQVSKLRDGHTPLVITLWAFCAIVLLCCHHRNEWCILGMDSAFNCGWTYAAV